MARTMLRVTFSGSVEGAEQTIRALLIQKWFHLVPYYDEQVWKRESAL